MSWKSVKIEDWCDVITGGTPSRSTSEFWNEGDIPWMTSGDINQIRIKSVEGRITKAGLDNSNTKLMPKKTVVIALNGQGKTRGMAGITETELTCNQSIVGIYPKEPNTVYPDFLFWNLYSRYKEIRYLRGGEFRSGLNMNMIKNLEFPLPFKENLPDVDEQKMVVGKIERTFGEVDEGLSCVYQENKWVETLKKSLLEQVISSNQMGTEKLSNIAATFLDGDWVEKKDQSSNGILLIQTGNIGIISYRDKEKKRFVNEETFKRLHCTEVFEGDILISRLPDPVGRACIIPKMPYRMITAVDCTIVRPKKNYSIRYLNYVLNAEKTRGQVYWMITGSSRKRISRKNLGEIELPIPYKNGKPNLVEQERIADKIETAFAGIMEITKLLESREQSFAYLRNSVLEEAFNPKIQEVPNSAPALLIIPPKIFDIQQAIGAILQRFERGEMVIAKILYLGQTIFSVPLNISFTPQNFGPYDQAVKKALTAGLARNNKFFARKGYVYGLSQNSQKLFAYSNSRVLKTMNKFLDLMMPHFKKAKSEDIERLATICEIVREKKTTDENMVYNRLSEWKPNRFTFQQTQKTLSFIKAQGWDKILT